MSLKKIIDAVVEINSTIEGINQSLNFEPAGQTVINSPCLYTKLKDFTVDNEPSAELSEYNITIMALIRYTDSEEAERFVYTLVDDIKATYRSKVKLDGVLSNGGARISGGDTVYVPISDIIYRVVKFNLRVYEKESVTFSD